jgi:uncharacterized membrane protein YjjP (DUF1212 family)
MEDKKEKIKFIQKLAYGLHIYGAPCYRIEAACTQIAIKLGFNNKSGFFSTPTSMFSTYVDEDFEEQSRLLRVEPASVNLEKLSQVDNIGELVVNSKLSATQAQKQLLEIFAVNDDKKVLKILSYAIIAANFTVYLNGNLYDALFALLIGAVVGIVTSRKKNNNLQYLSEGLAAFIATIFSYSLTLITPNINPPLITLASLIVLIPGLNITISVSELATNNLTSGTSRLVGAIMVLLKLAFGVYVAREMTGLFNFPQFIETSINHGMLLKFSLLPIAALGLTFSFKAALKDYIWILIIGLISVSSSNFVSSHYNVLLGTFIGALSVTLVSNLFSKYFKRPVLLMLLPGIIFLVPGSLGFKSIELFFHSDALLGMELAFQVAKIALALVTGLLFGNVFINPKRNI